MKLTLKVLSPENSDYGSSRGLLFVRRQQGAMRFGKHAFLSRGLRPDRASKYEQAATREIHPAARKERGHQVSSLVSKRRGIARWKSEAPIRAMKPGNSGGAKGGRKGTAPTVDMVQTQGWRSHDK